MINKDDILDLLAAGKSVDEIAADMADTLNAAKAEHDEIVAREVEEMKRLSAENDAKREAMRNILVACSDYISKYTNADLPEDLFSNPTDEEVEEICGSIDKLCQLFGALSGLEDMLGSAVESPKFKPNADDILKAFTSGMGW